MISTLASLAPQTPEIRTKIWLTADEAVFPAPRPGAPVFTTEEKLNGVIAVLHEGVDMMHAKTHSGKKAGKRRWDVVVKEREYFRPNCCVQAVRQKADTSSEGAAARASQLRPERECNAPT